MGALGQRQHAVEAQPRRAAPDDNVAVHQRHARRPIAALQATDPLSGEHWPAMPEAFAALAHDAAEAAGYAGFAPDVCLVNRYEPGTKLSLHQDRDEQDYGQPIVSVSLGLPAVFQFGGLKRSDRPARVPLTHGDVVVWGGPARLRFHGVLPLAEGTHPLLGRQRINLTFRKAG